MFTFFRRTAKPKQKRDIPLETWLVNAHAHYQDMAKHQAESFAKAGKPLPDETLLAPYIQAIHAQYNNLLMYCHHYLKSRLLLLKAKQILQTLKTFSSNNSPEARQYTETFIRHMERVLYAQSIERQVESMYEETFAVFIQSNVASRNDQNIPKCFLQRQPSLDCLFTHVAH